MRKFAACLGAWITALSASAAPPDYIRFRLFELVACADQIVYGETVDLGDRTFTLRVDGRAAGDPTGPELRVQRFVDWTCAARWTEYARGQRVWLFLRVPDRVGGPWAILGAGGEGEMPLFGDDVIVRGYRVRGREDDSRALTMAWGRGPSVSIVEMSAAVRGFRAAFSFERGQHFPSAIRPAVDEDQLSRFATSSNFAQHLVDQVKSSDAWTGELDSWPFLDAEATQSIRASEFALSGRERISSGPRPHRRGLQIDSLFGAACAFAGDVDGDGNEDLVAGAPNDNVLGAYHGTVWLFFLEADGSVRSLRELRDQIPGCPAKLNEPEYLGAAVTSLGDLDGDAVRDLAVGAPLWKEHGGVWALFLDRSGAARTVVELGEPLRECSAQGVKTHLGRALARVGDLDGDGAPELAIGNDRELFLGDRESGTAFVIVSLDSSANVRWAVRVPRRGNGMTDSSAFGETLAAVGDVDGDGISDLAVADSIDADGGEFRGAVWLCFLARDGSVRARTKISNWLGGFTGLTRDGERLGRSLAGAGDIDGDGTPDLLVGSATGVWTLFLRADGTVKGHRKLTNVPSDDGAAVGLSLAARRDQEDRVEVVSGGHLGSPTSPERVLWRLALTHDGVLQAR